MAAHGDRVPVLCSSTPYSKDVAHLIDLDITSQTPAFCYQPVSYLFILTSERKATHARAI